MNFFILLVFSACSVSAGTTSFFKITPEIVAEVTLNDNVWQYGLADVARLEYAGGLPEFQDVRSVGDSIFEIGAGLQISYMPFWPGREDVWGIQKIKLSACSNHYQKNPVKNHNEYALVLEQELWRRNWIQLEFKSRPNFFVRNLATEPGAGAPMTGAISDALTWKVKFTRRWLSWLDCGVSFEYSDVNYPRELDERDSLRKRYAAAARVRLPDFVSRDVFGFRDGVPAFLLENIFDLRGGVLDFGLAYETIEAAGPSFSGVAGILPEDGASANLWILDAGVSFFPVRGVKLGFAYRHLRKMFLAGTDKPALVRDPFHAGRKDIKNGIWITGESRILDTVSVKGGMMWAENRSRLAGGISGFSGRGEDFLDYNERKVFLALSWMLGF